MASDKEHLWDLGRLRIFSTVVREGSLTRAAAILGIPQPAISRQIAKLETECGGRLFLRTGRGVSLSDLGARVFPHVNTILGDALGLTAELHETAHTPTGIVRIGTLPSLHLTMVVPLYFQLRERFPGIHLQVYEGSAGQIDQWLANGYVDIGIPYRYGKPADDVEPLVRVSTYLLGPPANPLNREDTVKFKMLDGVPLVLPTSPSSVRLLLDQLAKRAGIRLNIAIEADSAQIQKAVARQAGAYAVLPVHAAIDEIEAGTLIASRIVEPEIFRTIVLGVTVARPAARATRETAKVIRAIMTARDSLFVKPLKSPAR